MSALRRLLLVTGLSGAGLSTALKTLEDLGYEAVDNLRPSLIPALREEGGEDAPPLAVSLDARARNFSAAAVQTLGERLKNAGVPTHLLYLDCDDDVLLRRFNDTRRRHPLAADRPVLDGITLERALIEPLKAAADRVLDTSLMTLHDLRRVLAGHYRLGAPGGMTLHLTSFGYRYGLPREADWVFDVRVLRNPYWEEALRPRTGEDPEVAAYVRQDDAYAPYLQGMLGWLTPLLSRAAGEGRTYLTLAVGCTGGRHRSVAVAEDLATALSALDYVVGLTHRDLARAARLEGQRRLPGEEKL